METIELICIQCENVFEFSAADAERYERMGYDPPQRCNTCRRNKLKVVDGSADYHRHYNKKREYHRKYA